MTDIIKIQEEINKQLANKEVFNALISTTFKGLSPINIKKAIMEGMMRGFEFKDFLENNVYAIPFRDNYSLITSIDYARKIGMRSGVVGKSPPEFTEKDSKVISCTITIKRKVKDYIGEYSDTVYLSEYSTGRNLWTSKPRTMLAKVAEMHALRMACPEELAQNYIEEELQKENKEVKQPQTMEQLYDAVVKMVQSSKNAENLTAIDTKIKESKKLKDEQKKELKKVVEEKMKEYEKQNTK